MVIRFHLRVQDLLHAADESVLQAHLNAVRVIDRRRQDIPHDPAREPSSGLILFEHDQNRHARPNAGAFPGVTFCVHCDGAEQCGALTLPPGSGTPVYRRVQGFPMRSVGFGTCAPGDYCAFRAVAAICRSRRLRENRRKACTSWKSVTRPTDMRTAPLFFPSIHRRKSSSDRRC
jgi:hypothetical protein